MQKYTPAFVNRSIKKQNFSDTFSEWKNFRDCYLNMGKDEQAHLCLLVVSICSITYLGVMGACELIWRAALYEEK